MNSAKTSIKNSEIRTVSLLLRMVIICVTFTCVLVGCAGTSGQESSSNSQSELPATQSVSQTNAEPAKEPATESEPASGEEPTPDSAGILQSPEDIGLQSADVYGTYYVFYYDDQEFWVYYEPDCWKVYDSYKITNLADITIICQALLNEHEVHGRDLESVRTAEDMAYEWQQHNLAYALAPKGSSWRESAQNVDLDPDEQNMSLQEIMETRGYSF